MKSKLLTVATVALFLTVAVWVWQRPLPSAKTLESTKPSVSGGNQVVVDPPQKSAVSSELSGTPGVDDKAGERRALTPELKAEIETLANQVIQPAADSVAGRDNARFQTFSMRRLARMQVPEATEVLTRILFLPEDVYFSNGKTSGGGDWQSNSHFVMMFLDDTVQGAPRPVNGSFYSTPDLAAFRKWWGAIKDNIPYKKLRPPPQQRE